MDIIILTYPHLAEFFSLFFTDFQSFLASFLQILIEIITLSLVECLNIIPLVQLSLVLWKY